MILSKFKIALFSHSLFSNLIRDLIKLIYYKMCLYKKMNQAELETELSKLNKEYIESINSVNSI